MADRGIIISTESDSETASTDPFFNFLIQPQHTCLHRLSQRHEATSKSLSKSHPDRKILATVCFNVHSFTMSSSSSRSRTGRKTTSTKQRTEVSSSFNDPYLLHAGTDTGNSYRLRRAIIRMEQIDMDNASTIRELKLENAKLKAQLARLREEAEQTGRIEERFEQLSSIIMDTQVSRTHFDSSSSSYD